MLGGLGSNSASAPRPPVPVISPQAMRHTREENDGKGMLPRSERVSLRFKTYGVKTKARRTPFKCTAWLNSVRSLIEIKVSLASTCMSGSQPLTQRKANVIEFLSAKVSIYVRVNG